MSQVYRAARRPRSYRPVRVSGREIRQPKHAKAEQYGRAAVVLAFGALSILDGIIFAILGLR